jgi:hypothetical protein
MRPVLNANGAPQFDAAETWNILESPPLRISVTVVLQIPSFLAFYGLA